jgi:hypothetical protein
LAVHQSLFNSYVVRFAQFSGEGLDLVLAPGDAYSLCSEPLRCGVRECVKFVLEIGMILLPHVVAVTDVAVEAVGTEFVVVYAVFYVAFAGGVVVAAYDVVVDVVVDAFLVAILNLHLLRFCCRGGVAVVRPFVTVCSGSSVLLRWLRVLLVASGRLGDRAASGKGRDGVTSSDGDVGSVTITDLWTVTYVFPSYCSDPDSLPTHLDCHEVTYAD